MLDVIKFIFQIIAMFINMLFSINIGFTSLGTFMCIIVFVLPLIIYIINMFKAKIRGD